MMEVALLTTILLMSASLDRFSVSTGVVRMPGHAGHKAVALSRAVRLAARRVRP
jgi:hypothetical protein